MDCLHAKQMLEPCAKGEIAAGERAELNRHVATCEGCRLELELTRAVLGSSSSSESPAAPDLADPVLPRPVEDDSPLLMPPPEPTIEQERLPQAETNTPTPPRVLTSQLPEEPEESFEVASIQPSNAYDPGAIDLPHTDPESEREVSTEGPTGPGGFSFDDLAAEPQAPGTPSSVSAGVPAGAEHTKSAGGSSPVWNFEPTDVPRNAAPPEESLTFAKEALDRKRGRAISAKRGARILLWVGGAVCGVGLLGASAWMALGLREPVSPEPATVPAVQPPPGTALPPTTTDSLAPAPDASAGLTGSDSTAQDAAGAVLKAGAAATGAFAPDVGSPKAASSKASTTKEPPRGATPLSGTTRPSEPEAASVKPGTPASAPPAFRYDELAPAPRRAPPILTVEPDASPGANDAYEPEKAPSASKEPKSVSTAPIFVPPGSEERESPGGTVSAPAEPEPSSPIGRLHLATVTAEKNKDLETLRKLKSSWKAMIRSSVGADRSRSKRELADCLWAIQGITQREADRKEALSAYREYVLHAPAGGADARTVSRMRQLEEMLSEAH